MEICPRCGSSESVEAPYCVACRRPQIVEGLRRPRAIPRWQEQLVLVIAAVVLLWFLITFLVAFLREAKAVRRGREAVLAGQSMDALGWLDPFLERHPKHREGLFWATRAAVQTRQAGKAISYYKQFDAMAPKRKPELQKLLFADLDAASTSLGCNLDGFNQLYSDFAPLGDEFGSTLRDSSRHLVQACLVENQTQVATGVIRWVLNGSASPATIDLFLLDPLKESISMGQYVTAERIGRLALQVAPQYRSSIDQAVAEPRAQVAKTLAAIYAVRGQLKTDPRYRSRGGFCFPASTPAEVSTALDAWGTALAYHALSPDSTGLCHRGFELVSLGADRAPTPTEEKSPASEISCRAFASSEWCDVPGNFWLSSRQGG